MQIKITGGGSEKITESQYGALGTRVSFRNRSFYKEDSSNVYHDEMILISHCSSMKCDGVFGQ